MTHYPETPWNLTPRQQEVMDAYVAACNVREAAQSLGANLNTVEELLRQARIRMDARCQTEAVLMWDRFRRGDIKPVRQDSDERKSDWIHARVTREQAQRVRQLGGSQFLRNLIEENAPRPMRLEDAWRGA